MKFRRILTLLLAVAICLSMAGCGQSGAIKKAQKLLDEGDYSAAYDALRGIQDSEQADAIRNESLYRSAMRYFEKGDYVFAENYFERLGDYSNSKEMILACRYEIAKGLLAEGRYDLALEAFNELGDYSDSKAQTLACYYGMGSLAVELEDYLNANRYFRLAGDYEDAVLKADEALYLQGNKMFAKGQTAAAQAYFDKITVFPDYAAPHFETLADAREYLRQQRESLSSAAVCYILSMPDYINRSTISDALYNYFPYMAANMAYDESDKELYILPTYYPSERILYAWRTGDTSVLSDEEYAVMQQALDLVSQAQASSDNPIEVEKWLYDWLHLNVAYGTYNKDISPEVFVTLRQPTCIGALVDKRANCQGYADAFYLLGTMAGFDVCKFAGYLQGGAHAWNGIMLDGKLYMVDATGGVAEFDKNEVYMAIKYSYAFNVPYDPAYYTFCGDPEMFPELATAEDWSWDYSPNRDVTFESLDDAVMYMLTRYKNGNGNSAFAVVLDAKVVRDDLQSSVWSVGKKLGLKKYSLTPNIQYYNGNTYITLKW